MLSDTADIALRSFRCCSDKLENARYYVNAAVFTHELLLPCYFRNLQIITFVRVVFYVLTLATHPASTKLQMAVKKSKTAAHRYSQDMRNDMLFFPQEYDDTF